MKESKHVLLGLLGLILLLFGYGAFITVRASNTEERLNRLEASYEQLQASHRVLSNTISHVQVTPELLASLKAAMAREGRALGPATNRDLRLTGSELNAPSRDATSK